MVTAAQQQTRSRGMTQPRRRRGAAPRPVRRRWRLTRRGRVAVVATIALVLVLLAAPGLRDQASAADSASGPEPVMVVVGPGDTVWDLALAHLPQGADAAEYAARVVADNEVDAAALRPGDVLALPQS